MARRIDKLQINASNASNNQILVARSGQLAFDDPENVFVGTSQEANAAQTANFANVALEANVANTVLSISNFTTDDLTEGSNLYYTNARVLAYLSETDVTIGGNLVVNGTTTTLNTATLTIEDKNIVLANGAINAAAADGAGITIEGAGANITYRETGDKFVVNKNLVVEGNVVANGLIIRNIEVTDDILTGNILASGITANSLVLDTITANVYNGLPTPNLSLLTTDNLTEGSNLYYTNARVLSAVNPSLTTANVAELTNLYYTNARVTTHVESTTFSNVNATTITANSFASSGTGTPTIESATSINLSANGSNGGAVVIQNSALRLRSYTDGEVANLTASAGDVVFNSSATKAQIYDGVNWANVGAEIIAGDQEYSGNLIPKVSNTYSLGSAEYRWKDLYLSGNTIFLGDVQLSSSNNRLTVSSVETGELTIDRLSFYTAGRGISITQGGQISTSADDSELYDIGVDTSIGYKLTDSMETVLNYSASNEFPALLYSFILTNISSETSNVTGTYRDPEGNVITFINNMPTTVGNVIEFTNKPEVILPNTVISLRAEANDTVYASLVLKTTDDSSYTQKSSNISVSGEYTDVFITDNDAIVESIKVNNMLDTPVPVTVIWTDEDDNIRSYFASNVSVPPNGFRQIIASTKLLNSGDKIKIANFSGQSDAITCMVSARFGEFYSIVPSSTVVTEGQTLTFAVTALNVPSFSTRYFRTLGDVSNEDFAEGNTGSFLIIDGKANIVLNLVNDLSEFAEGEEKFRLLITRSSPSGGIGATSQEITVLDTSNLINYSSSSVPAEIYETEEATITINTVNALGNPGGILYYTVTGNADIFSNTSGSIIVNDNQANLAIIAEATVPDNQSRIFAIDIRRTSISGNIIGTTDSIVVKPIVANVTANSKISYVSNILII